MVKRRFSMLLVMLANMLILVHAEIKKILISINANNFMLWEQ